MERRNRSLKALEELIYIDSLDSNERADSLITWYDEYLSNDEISNFDLELEDLKKLSELFYKNIDFLNKFKEKTRQEMVQNRKMQRFLQN